MCCTCRQLQAPFTVLDMRTLAALPDAQAAASWMAEACGLPAGPHKDDAVRLALRQLERVQWPRPSASLQDLAVALGSTSQAPSASGAKFRARPNLI